MLGFGARLRFCVLGSCVGKCQAVKIAGMSTSLFPTPVYARRLADAQQQMRGAGIAALVVAPGPHLAYLVGLDIHTHERFTALLLPAQGQAALLVPAVDASDVEASAVGQLSVKVHPWIDGQQPHRIAAQLLDLDATAVVGVSPDLSADHLLRLQAAWGEKVRTVLATEVLAALFVAKDQEEIAELRHAAQAIDRVHQAVTQLLVPGVSEAQVADKLRDLILQEHEAVDFIIVGSGPNGASPHHSYSSRVLQPGELVVVDIGGTTARGYHSDCTRTYVVGDPASISAQAQRMYQVLFDAQQAQRAAVRPGVTAAEVDHIGRSMIEAAGFGEYFIHRTGHGIGLSTHEEPFIMAGNDLVLQPGMAFSIEPGIYLPGECGARIEDIVVVTQTGCEALNTNPRELLGSKP